MNNFIEARTLLSSLLVVFTCRHRSQQDALSTETREGWSLLTFETEVNGDSKSTNERGPSLVGSLGLLCRYKRFCFCLVFSSRPSTTFSIPLSPSPSKLDSKVVLGDLSLSMCLWLYFPLPSRLVSYVFLFSL